MKRIIIFLLTAILVITITACENNKTGVKNNESNGEKKDIFNEVKEDKTESNVELPQYSFFGKWEIIREVATAPVSALDEDDIKRIVGRQISYTEDSASSGDHILRKPYYELRIITKLDFESGNRVSFEKLGINSDSIIEVFVNESEPPKRGWEYTGGCFYIKDNDTLILAVGNVFFEAKRVK